MEQKLCAVLRKLRSRQAETLSELLVSVLVIVMGLTMFASALMAARKMLSEGDALLHTYYAERNILEAESGTVSADLIFHVENGTNRDRVGFALKQSVTGSNGIYQIKLHSEQKQNATDGTGTSEPAKYFRYSR